MASVQISAYEFGKIVVDGESYSSDVIIAPDRVIDSWWRKEGHRLQIDDLDDIVQATPDILVVGTGYYGRMQIPAETRQYLRDQGIEVREARTPEAVAVFNELQQEYARIVAALHLTC